MELDVKFEEKDLQHIRQVFSRLRGLGKSDGLTRKMASVLQEDAEDAFAMERTPDGVKWRDLSPKYKKQRYNKGYTGNILQRHGDLAGSLNIAYGDNFAAVGVAEHYGEYHQLGTKKMSARPFLGISEDGVEEIKEILNNAIRRALRD
ncbi:virion morphogenesis protein [[Haemophilus] ducreyi]|uniref:Mu-like phage G protein 1 n=2 Tax=Haemophilus ducreyi TaxID=730 RepID=Q7VPF5_HAEDU|nr:phage virion morphogenesis protein [[Haemophilus] ducreyi]AAP95126.1 Mu-like phage G protein 1 [[Haemophilus] ducreyi 35000HP]AKO30300.1 Mu-like prophage FluMu G protein 1 [[Haemophilus] ducreyi]AKO31733.1 Mu-like prophage FluMu G protein 1 [[Haemophilus] ducreyi]AKO33186.1 Mu-like prophage FluMu G protein 1 [[Haemophilus] ducreyi]AKO34635.1 Mu-like prophage FluMu G protein 1 [[Haemophilus] ducreyi]